LEVVSNNYFKKSHAALHPDSRLKTTLEKQFKLSGIKKLKKHPLKAYP